MESLSQREQELVAIGAAIGSNCVPCIQYHVPAAKKAGLTDRQIRKAIRLADKVRHVPAGMVLETALALLGDQPAPPEQTEGRCERAAALGDPPGATSCCDD